MAGGRQAWATGWSAWWTALTFLTTLPAPRFAPPPRGLGAAAGWFPVVGLLLGGLLWAVQVAASALFDPWLTGLLVAAAWAALTGALHLDGVADCGDALLAATTRERRLEILRDPRLGTFGAVTLIFTLLLKAAAAGTVPGPALLLAPVWARWLLLVAARLPQARPGGLGASFAASLRPRLLWFALATPLLLLLVVIGPGGAFLPALLAVASATGVAAGIMRLATARLGGVTGDVLGLVVEASEISLLLVFVAATS